MAKSACWLSMMIPDARMDLIFPDKDISVNDETKSMLAI